LLFPLVCIHGLTGTGKSHLARGLMDAVIRQRPDAVVRLIPARDLGRVLVESSDSQLEFRDCDLLIIEDIQHLPAVAHEAVIGLLDHRRVHGLGVLVTADGGPARLPSLSIRLVTRLGAGLVVPLSPLSLRSRRRLSRRLCRREGLYVTSNVLDWLARKTTSGSRSIRGDVSRLKELSVRFPPPLDQRALTALESTEETATDVERVVAFVADHYGISIAQMKRRDRIRRFLQPRQVAMYLARALTPLSYPEIGRTFGGYDHTTVLHACRRVEERRDEDWAFAHELEELKQRLG